MERAGRPITANPNTVGLLQRLGFVDVEQVTFKVPFNTWPLEEHEKLVGQWFNLAITQGLFALSAAPLTRMNGYEPEQVSDLCARVRKEICTRAQMAFCTM